MNFLNLLRSIESAIFETAFWVVLIPKTTYRIIKSPQSIPSYINAELGKDEKNQFVDLMSPILLWLLLLVIPGYRMNQHFNSELPLLKVGTTEQNILVYASSIFSLVLGPAIAINICLKRKFERGSFKTLIYTQCYLQAPAMGLLIICYSLLYYYNYDFRAADHGDYIYFLNSINGWKDIFFFFGFVPLLWLLYAEIRVIMLEKNSAAFVFLTLVVSFIVSSIIILVTVAITYLVFGKYIFL